MPFSMNPISATTVSSVEVTYNHVSISNTLYVCNVIDSPKTNCLPKLLFISPKSYNSLISLLERVTIDLGAYVYELYKLLDGTLRVTNVLQSTISTIVIKTYTTLRNNTKLFN